MSGDTHAAVGAAFSLAFAAMAGSPLVTGAEWEMAGLGLVSAAGALFPDLDLEGSKGNDLLDGAVKVGIFALAGLAVLQRPALSGVPIGRLAAIAAFFGLAFWCRTRPHREATHSILMMAAATFCVHVAFAGGYWIGFGLGYLSHLLLDYFNAMGESILWPFPGKFCLHLCSSSGSVDSVLKYLGVAVTAFVLICR